MLGKLEGFSGKLEGVSGKLEGVSGKCFFDGFTKNIILFFVKNFPCQFMGFFNKKR